MSDGRLDVACFLPTLAGGGAERVILDVASALQQDHGRKVAIVVAHRSGALADAVPAALPVVDLRRKRTVGAILPLALYLRQKRPRALLSTLEHANLVSVLATRWLGGTRVVLREANSVSQDIDRGSRRGRVMFGMMRLLYPRADAVIAVSEGVASELEHHLGLSRERVHVIRNPVLTPRVWEGARAPLGHPWFGRGQPPVVLGVGRLAPQKGFDTLLQAFARARRQTPCRLMILGEGELRDSLTLQAHQLGVGDDVSMPGFVENPFPYLAGAGAFVLSSLWEGLPNVLIQAVALGTPVVATDCPSGPSEILDGGRLGRLVLVGDVEAMAESIVEALRTSRESPRPSWLDRYRPDAIAAAYDDVLLGAGD